MFLSVSTLIIAYYILSFWSDPVAGKTVLAFGMMSYGSWIALGQMGQYYKVPDGGGFPIDWDEDLDRRGLAECFLAALGIFLVSMFFTGVFGQAVLYVPEAKALGILETGASLTNQILNEVLYQTFIVAAAEESMKLSAMVGLTLQFRHSANQFLRSRSREVAAVLVIGIWAFLHAMIAYQNIYMTLAAFLAGIVLFYLLLRTKSLLAVIVAHSSYNAVVRVITLLTSESPLFYNTIVRIVSLLA